jgi:hypothetical protein
MHTRERYLPWCVAVGAALSICIGCGAASDMAGVDTQSAAAHDDTAEQASASSKDSDTLRAAITDAVNNNVQTPVIHRSLLESVRAELGNPSLLVIDPTRTSTTATTKADYVLFGYAEADADIAEGVSDLLELVNDLGIDTTHLDTALSDTLFHEEGSQSGGIQVPASGLASSVTLSLADTWRYGFSGLHFVVVYDGHSHTIFRHDDAVALRNSTVLTAQTQLTTASVNALHELIHIMLKQQHLDQYDDADDALVSLLEWALIKKINVALQIQVHGEADPVDVQLLSNNIAHVLDLPGGLEALKKLGLIVCPDDDDTTETTE